MPDPTDTKPTEDTGSTNTVSMTIDGKTVEKTLEEVVKMAEKVGGADARFREAAEIRKAAQNGVEIMELKGKLEDGDASDEEIDRWVEIWDLTDDDKAFLKGEEPAAKNKPAPQKKDPVPPRSPGSEEKKVKFEDLDPRIQKSIQVSEEQDRAQREREFKEEVAGAIKASDELKEILKKVEEKERGGISKFLQGQCESEVVARLFQGERYGTKFVKKTVDSVIQRAIKFGSLFRGGDTPVPGIPSDGSSVPMNIQGDKPIERVASDTPNYSDNFAARFRQQQARAVYGK